MGGAVLEDNLALTDVTDSLSGLLYAPLHLHLPRRKHLQVLLLHAEAAAVTARFNTESARVARQRRACADKIVDLLDRVKSIQRELQCSEMPTALPEAADDDAQRFLRVSDSEVAAPKWISGADRYGHAA
jgi:hypothetical protein